MTDHDNQFTDAAQLVATHRAAHADTATARLAQVAPDATLVQDERFMTMQQLAQAERRIAELEQENQHLRYIAEYFMDGYWETVHIGIPYQRLTVTIQQDQLDQLRAKMALAGE